jgi:hypothetical protein
MKPKMIREITTFDLVHHENRNKQTIIINIIIRKAQHLEKSVAGGHRHRHIAQE